MGAKILIEIQVLRQNWPDWFVLEVTEVEGDPPMIKAVKFRRTVSNQPAAIFILSDDLAGSLQASPKE